MIPDPETLARLKHLAKVGNFLYLISNEEGQEDDSYFLAKTSLTNFVEGLNKLEMDPETKDGMDKLVKYLDKKIEKRSSQFRKKEGGPS